MKKPSKSWRSLSAAAILALASLAPPLAAQQTAEEAKQGSGANPEEYARRLRPEDKFEILGRFAGTWEGNLSAWLETKPPKQVTIKDRLEAKWILNDRFLDASFTLDFGGAASKGRVTMGYNSGTGQYYRIFLSDMDPRGTISTGHYIRSRNALVFKGPEHDPVTGDSFEKRESFTFVDKDKIQFEQFYTFADGSEVKVAEGYYTRVTGK